MQKIFKIFSCSFLVFMSPFIGHAWTEGELREQIEARIKDRHPHPDSEFWLSVGKSGSKVLRELYSQTNSTYEKIRILESLVWFRESENTRFLKSVTNDEKTSILKSRALRSVALSEGLNEENYLVQMSHHSDPLVQKEALHLLDETRQQRKITQEAKKQKVVQPGRVMRIQRYN